MKFKLLFILIFALSQIVSSKNLRIKAVESSMKIRLFKTMLVEEFVQVFNFFKPEEYDSFILIIHEKEYEMSRNCPSPSEISDSRLDNFNVSIDGSGRYLGLVGVAVK